MNGLVVSRVCLGLHSIPRKPAHNDPLEDPFLFRALKSIATIALYVAMLVAILALWNNNAPQFIYVAF